MNKFIPTQFFLCIILLTSVACSSDENAEEPTYKLNNFDSNAQAVKDSLSNFSGNPSIKPISSYDDARKIFWRNLYNNGGETLYCGESFGRGYNKGINIEHVFPMSWVTKSLKCGQRKECRNHSDKFNQIEADLHNLFPSKSHINKARSSFAFGMVSGERRNFGRCDFEIGGSRPTFVEPRDSVRGDIARTMFYMADTYPSLQLFKKQIRLLKKWHKDDPVSTEEKWRNDKIESIQGNRNPFIDMPNLINQRF